MTRIIGHLSVAELEQRHRAAQDATEARHTRAIWLLAQERGVLDVAGVLGFAPRWVEQLAARDNAQGADALGDRRRGNGRAARVLTTAVLAALAGRLRAPPEDGARWTGAKVAIWMAARLGLERVRPQRGWEALTRIGWSVQAPRPQAPRPRHPRAATPEQRAAGSGQRSKGARRGGRARQGGAPRPAGRGLGRGRAPPRAEADPPARVGAHRQASHRARPPPPQAAACHGMCPADQRRGGLVAVHRPVQALVRGPARPLRTTGRRRRSAQEVGAGRERHVVPALDNAGWHGPKNLAVPDGIALAFLPPYSPERQPERQPAERLWPLVDEPVANRHLATLDDLDAVVAERCRRLDAATIQPHTDFHWWPKPVQTN